MWQNGNINKNVENTKRNFGPKEYNNWNGKFTKGIQRHTCVGRIISKFEDRTIRIVKSENKKAKNEEKWTELKGDQQAE